MREFVSLDEIRGEVSGTIDISAPGRKAVADLLELSDLASLRLDYRLRGGGGGRYHLSGRLLADVTQTCVITLEPVDNRVDVPVEVEFWPSRLIEELEARLEEGGDAAVEWPEPIGDGNIDLGPVIYETLATSLDPYPKKEGASFQWADERATAEKAEKTSPFAALARLKRS